MKRIALPLIAAILILFAGYKVANMINRFLGISFKEKTLPEVPDWKSIMREKEDSSTIQSYPLELRLADLGAVGISPDSNAWGDNYSHNTRQFEDVFLPDSPYVDDLKFKTVEKDFRLYVNLIDSLGANGIVFDGFLEFVNFDSIGSGYDIYTDTSFARKQHVAFRKYFGRLFNYAKSQGLDVFLNTDMVALTTPLEHYFKKQFGSIKPGEKDFWQVYKNAFAEIFNLFPEVKGFVIRIGEAGAIYNTKGWDYRSELYVRTDSSVRFMLKNLLDVAERYGKLIIFRTWSVGVGKIGDMHTNPATYSRVLDSIHSPALVVSTKYCKGDYDSYLALNPTLMTGKHRRIIEFQDRREFEGFGAMPNYLGPLYQSALKTILKNNRNVIGAWHWTQRGGPLRAGPLSLYPFYGFNLITDANVYIMSMLMNNPYLRMKKATSLWVSNKFGDDTLLVKNLTRVLLMSHQTMDKGLYIGLFARWDVKAMGLELTPNMWLFKWDILNGSCAVMSNIYIVCKDSIEIAVKEGRDALMEVRQMQKKTAAVKGRIRHNSREFSLLEASLEYEYMLFNLLSSYREYFLHYYAWIDRGSPTDRVSWQLALDSFNIKKNMHLEKYIKNLDFPAYNFTESDKAVKMSERSWLMTWLSRILFVFFFTLYISGIPFINRKIQHISGSKAFSALFNSAFLPSSVKEYNDIRTRDIVWLAVIDFLAIAGGSLVISSFLAPVFTLTITLTLAAFILLSIILFTMKDIKTDIFNALSLASSVVVFFTFLFAVMSVRGPNYLWFNFWTSELFRYIFIILFFFILIWRSLAIIFISVYRIKLSVLKAVSGFFVLRGFQFLIIGIISYFLTLEKCLTALNDELLIIPTGLSKILGITTHLNIPERIPLYLIIAGAVLMSAGIITKIKKSA